MLRRLILIFFVACFSQNAFAIYTELGISYSYKKTSFDKDNYTESQSTTASVSFYFWEQVALELSYTNGVAVRKERQPTNPFADTDRFVTQNSSVYGADLVFSLADRKAMIQPYIKGGAAYITKEQITKDQGQDERTISTKPGVAPSAGAGIKIMITEALAIRAGVDVWSTPVDNETKTDDMAGRAGLTWAF